MDSVISTLKRALSRTQEPALRQQLTDTIERLRERRRRENSRVPRQRDSTRRSPPSVPARKTNKKALSP